MARLTTEDDQCNTTFRIRGMARQMTSAEALITLNCNGHHAIIRLPPSGWDKRRRYIVDGVPMNIAELRRLASDIRQQRLLAAANSPPPK